MESNRILANQEGEGEEEELTEEAQELMKQAYNNQDCTTCSHFPVCQIYRSFKKIMASEYGPESENSRNNDCPIQAEHLAKICDMYIVGGR